VPPHLFYIVSDAVCPRKRAAFKTNFPIESERERESNSDCEIERNRERSTFVNPLALFTLFLKMSSLPTPQPLFDSLAMPSETFLPEASKIKTVSAFSRSKVAGNRSSIQI